MILDGADIGSPAGVTQDMIIDEGINGSPIRILVTEETAGTTRNVHVEVQTVQDIPAGTYRIKGAVAERLIEYGSAPGSNGETEFPNVFRQGLISGTTGDIITLAPVGSSVSFDYSYELDPLWQEDEIYALVWVQNSSSKEVLNSGAPGDPPLEYVNTSSVLFTQGGGSFGSIVNNIGDIDEGFTVTLTVEQPADWSASYTYGGSTYSGAFSTSATAGELEDLTLNVETGTTPGVGFYTLTLDPDHEGWSNMIIKYYTVNGVTDLVLNNVTSFGDGSPYGTWNFESMYTDGLDLAENTSYGVAGHNVFIAGMKGDAFGELKNIYFNVGWTFPSLLNDELRNYLTDFMDNGGNLFISGQDIGWEADYYATEFGLTGALNFYENYLHSVFVNDGATGAGTLTAIADDEVFGTVAESNIIDDVYGSSYFYPEQIDVADADGHAIFSYGGNDAKIAGVRSETSDNKTVYLGIGIEQIEDEAIRSQVVKLSHDYFYGLVNGIEFDAAIASLMGSASPNPASNATSVSFNGLDHNVSLVITSLTGQVIKTLQVPAGTGNYEIDVTDMESGMYLYHITDGQSQSPAQKLNVIK